MTQISNKVVFDLFAELVSEFSDQLPNVLSDPRIVSAIKTGSFPEKGKKRYGGSNRIFSGNCFSVYQMNQVLRSHTAHLPSSRKIYNYIYEQNLWPIHKGDTFETDLYAIPSIHANLIAGFLSRNFEINNFQVIITDASFYQAFAELEYFFANDTVEITTFLTLHGVTGESVNLSLDRDVVFRNADHYLVVLFGLFYSTNDILNTELFENDCILAIRYTYRKEEWRSVDQSEKKILEKWFLAVLLTLPGNIEYGKIYRDSIAWPVNTIKAPNSLSNSNPYDGFLKSDFIVTKDHTPVFLEVAEVIQQSDLSVIDERIKYSIERLKKAKSSRNIDDRIIELALALEFLINTSNNEVILQLCLKTIRLIAENNQDETIFRDLKKFYSLRSKVMHGNDKIPSTDENRDLVYRVEKIIQKMLLRYLELNPTYSFKQINIALERALYISSPLRELLEHTKIQS